MFMTDQQRRDHYEGMRNHYVNACARLSRELIAPPVVIEKIKAEWPDILVREGGNGWEEIGSFLLETLQGQEVSWPEYDTWHLESAQEAIQEEVEWLTKADISDLISMLKLPALRALYREFAGPAAPSPGGKRADVGNSLYGVLNDAQRSALAERLRAEALSDLEQSSGVCCNERALAIYRRIQHLAYVEYRKGQLRADGFTDFRPYWELFARSPSWDERGPSCECKKLMGKPMRHDDSFWNNVPCDRFDCACEPLLHQHH